MMKTDVEKEIFLGKTSHTVERNKQILVLLAQDKRPKEIAKDMFLGLWCVRKSIQKMMEANGYHSVWGLVAAAIRKNQINY